MVAVCGLRNHNPLHPHRRFSKREEYNRLAILRYRLTLSAKLRYSELKHVFENIAWLNWKFYISLYKFRVVILVVVRFFAVGGEECRTYACAIFQVPLSLLNLAFHYICLKGIIFLYKSPNIYSSTVHSALTLIITLGIFALYLCTRYSYVLTYQHIFL